MHISRLARSPLRYARLDQVANALDVTNQQRNECRPEENGKDRQDDKETSGIDLPELLQGHLSPSLQLGT